MKNFFEEMFTDTILSNLTKKYGTKLNDDERINKCAEIIDELKNKYSFYIGSIQNVIDRKGINDFEATNLNGKSVYVLVKRGFIGKPKIVYYISRTKEEITEEYLSTIYEEIRQQANGTNVFSAADYKN